MSLRKFLKSNDVKKVTYPCSVDYEIAAHVREVCDNDGPILLFNDSSFPGCCIVGGVYATKERIKRIFSYYGSGLTLPALSDDFFYCVKRFSHANRAALSSEPLQNFVNFVQPSKAPVLENTIEENDVDFRKIPICIHNEKDNGKFITAGVNVVKWVDGKTHGLGIHRMNVIDKNHLSCLAPPNRRIGFPYYEASKRNESITMAVVIGAPPEVVLASQSKIPSTCEKYIVASQLPKNTETSIKDDLLNLVHLPFSDLWIPSEAEMVLECESVPNSFHNDVPFAEYPGTYSTRTNAWIVKVKKIHYRNNYLYQTILTGKLPQEDSNLCAIPYASDVYDIAKKYVEKITDVSVFLGNNVFDTIVCVKKTSNSQIQNLMYALLGNKYLKSITIMDDDLKAAEEDWRFAFNTRYQPNRDTIITNLSLGASLDPSSPLFQSTSKIAFDFTIPVGKTKEDCMFNKFRHSRASTKKCYINKDRWKDWKE